MRKVVVLYIFIIFVALLPLLQLEIAEADFPQVTYRGLSWYGIDLESFSYWHLTETSYNLMVSRYPNMTILVLPFSSWSYSDPQRLQRLDDFIGWCSADGIKVMVSNYAETYSKSAFITYWQNMATHFDDDTTIDGFDLVNEPWGMSGTPSKLGDNSLVEDYIDMIQAIRAIDPNRKCYVQSYEKNWDGDGWAEFIGYMEANLTAEGLSNVDYVNHIYSHNWEGGGWRTSAYVYPWIPYYSSGDYVNGYAELYDECWDDFAQHIDSYNIKFFMSEVATQDDANSRRYFSDLIDILEGWGVDWAYAHYYTPTADRPLVLTYPTTENERGHADTVRTCMQTQTALSRFEDDFESASFYKWNETQTSNGEATITSSIVHDGSYAANFTVTGASNSYARVYYTLEYSQREIYQRTYFRLEDLLDTDGGNILLLRIADSGGNYLAYSGIYRGSNNHYWRLSVDNTTNGEINDYEEDTINADQWYCYEMYLDASASGNATIWVDGVQKNSLTGDFSGLDDIARMYLMNYILATAQASSKTVYHDDYIVDTEYIGMGSPQLFKGMYAYISENQPLANVLINGTGTDEDGYYDFANLVYDTIYTFVVDPPTGYYPAWCLNIHGDFNWNGSCFILSHNVSEGQEDYIELYFHDQPRMYINQTSLGLRVTSGEVTIETMFGDEYTFSVIGIGWITIHTSNYDEEPFLCSGASVSSKTYDSGTQICNMTVSATTTLTLLFNRPTPSAWGSWWD